MTDRVHRGSQWCRVGPVTRMATVVLKAGHVQPVWAGHPWVYAQAVQHIDGGAVAGDEVAVVDPRGNYIGRGFYSPGSAIPVRILLRDRETVADAPLFRARLERAVERRRLFGLPSSETSAVRIVNAEGDDLPGLVIDLFGEVAVVQIGTIGMKRREQAIFDAIEEVLRPRAILDRTSAQTARAERFTAGQGVVRGDIAVSSLSFVERGIRY